MRVIMAWLREGLYARLLGSKTEESCVYYLSMHKTRTQIDNQGYAMAIV